MLASLLLTLLPLAVASPFVPRQNIGNTTTTNTTSTGTTTGSASPPTVTIYPSSGGSKPVSVTGVAYPQFGQDVYLGIPYAAPPVGHLRFTPPQQAIYNSSSISAQKQPPACLQRPTAMYTELYGQSEDCLYLNIFTPKGSNQNTTRLPVLVWVYGGSFTSGAASFYNASAIVAQGIQTQQPVVVVTINYRLGILGFGYGDEIAENNAANLGLKDAIASLQWIQENIYAFGGNADSVTVFGESAGAIIISLMYLDPSIKLFKSAIMESGAQSTAPIGRTDSTWQGPYDATVGFANCTVSNSTASQYNSSFACLKALPATALLNASLQAVALPQYQGGFVFAPSVDGGIIPDSPHTLLAQGKFARIPYISGNNKDEGTVFTPTFINSTQLVTLAINLGQPRPPNSSIVSEALEFYPDDPSLGSPFDTGNATFGLSSQYKRLAAILGDGPFQSSRRWFLQQSQAYGLTQTWSYLFTALTPGADPRLGSYHGSEVAFVYGSVSTARNYTAADLALSRNMINYWINFAYYTDPNGARSNATYWPAYGDNRTLLQLDPANYTLIPDTYRQEQIDFFLSEPVEFNLKRST